MGVYIKGMEMPTRCFACPMCEVENAEVNCVFSHGSYIEYREVDPKVAIQERPSWCSLVEVPPHGRLIDADALESTLNKMGIWGDARVKGFIKSIPTVIPADTDLETLSSGVYNQPVRESNYPNQPTYKIPPFNWCGEEPIGEDSDG